MFTSSSTAGKRSDNNPFRTPTLTPNPTGASASQSTTTTSTSEVGIGSAINSDGQARTDGTRDFGEDRGSRQEASTSSGNDDPSIAGLAEELQRSNLDSDADTTPTPAEPPPAYTPSADFFQGEATVQYGPRRPFQQAPPAPPLPPHLSPQGTGASRFPGAFPSSEFPPAPMLYIDPTGSGMGPSSGWGAGPLPPQPTGGSAFSSSPYRPPLGPPPRHPSSASMPPGSRVFSEPNPPQRPMSDFARDFYGSREAYEERAASSDDESNEGPEPPTRNPIEASSSPSRADNASLSSGGALNYAPPPGPPPGQRPPTSPRNPPPSSASSAQYAPPAGPPPSRASNDDGKPTSSPTPGRPYLNKGRVLVYPAGHECRKCLNTGYKHFDPSHPCRKCWERYGKPYAGAIVSAPWDAPASSASRLQYQRPLPTFRPPHLRHQHSRSQPSLLSPSDLPSSPNVLRSSRSSMYAGDYPGAQARAQGQQLQPQAQMQAGRPGAFNISRGTPPPGATVVRPGDPRIGGRLCWRCGGDGMVSFLIFDLETCPICRGVGRVF
ncbi:hypothetical protein SCHPADRAFT_687519 [Schizopora paradoxa]|uniref:Uncharacterized protein n=1 Tax=Schizopora paradoxa TaxID=27342 RepID=A0A0H2RNZ8_9AGAM|nr:hypothetical protein SCHPADRAFT_687519 [Schizopora paradoxa]